MGNLLQYTDKSKTIDNKLQTLLSQINYQYKNGEIRTEIEYYYKIKTMLNTFYESLTKPSFIYRPAVTTPISSEYNAMINESYNDMEYIIKDCEALQEYVSQSFVDAQLSRTMMSNQLSYLMNKVQNIKQSIALNQGNNVIIFSDSFNDCLNTGNSKSQKACTVNTFEGILTLRQISSSQTGINSVIIDNEKSNGFPGNTHCVDTLNNDIHFVGQDGLHIDPLAMIDGNKDTWFEFELFNINDKVRQECNSYGFSYEEGIQWADNSKNKLRLKVVLELTQRSMCSWISVLPYLSDAKGGTFCILEKCEVFAANSYTYKVAENQAFDEVLTFAFPAQYIDRVELTFVQDTRYLCKVGHFYYTNVNTDNLSIFQNFEDTDRFTRIDGPKPQVSMLKAKYDPTTQWLKYGYNNSLTDTYIKSALFTVPESTIDRKSNVEIIDAYRYMIGIREIKIPNCVFEDSSEYISTVFETDDLITSVMLETDEYIPGNDPDILKYYITFDNGGIWYPITPIQRAHDGIYKYYINNDSLENVLTNGSEKFKAQNLSILTNTKQVQLKIEMTKPFGIENYDYATPIVYSYKLKVTTGGDTIEY